MLSSLAPLNVSKVSDVWIDHYYEGGYDSEYILPMDSEWITFFTQFHALHTLTLVRTFTSEIISVLTKIHGETVLCPQLRVIRIFGITGRNTERLLRVRELAGCPIEKVVRNC